MLTLFFSPGACSMASHIALEEIGVPYVERRTMIDKGEGKTEAYLRINPRGRVPALVVEDDQVLVENTAILVYLARRFPESRLLPADPLQEARCISTMAWFSNAVHPSFTHFRHPQRFADEAAAQPSIREKGKAAFWSYCQEIDSLLLGKDWIMGDQFTVADGYALVFYGWGLIAGLPMHELGNYTAFKGRMLQRPAVRKVLEGERSVLVKPAAPAA